MTEKIYKLPLDEDVDRDLLTWINSLPRNKKAEVVRHALRFYKSQLKEGETFIMPSSVSQDTSNTLSSNPDPVPETKPKKKAGINLANLTRE